MGTTISQVEGENAVASVRCPICAQANAPGRHCRHVRWTFEQGGPLEFARFALDASPYTRARGFALRDISKRWWAEHEEWLLDDVLLHFDANDGYVFGELADLDLLARDVWCAFRPDPEPTGMTRVDVERR